MSKNIARFLPGPVAKQHKLFREFSEGFFSMGRRGPKPQPGAVKEQKAPVRSRQRKTVKAASAAVNVPGTQAGTAIKPWRDEVTAEPDVNPPPFSDAAATSTFVLREASAAIHTWNGHGQGFTGHMLTFGQALVELAQMGNLEWAESCRATFCKYVTITRQGPGPSDKPIAEHKPTKLRPDSAQYWEQRGENQLGIGHVFKYPYSYYDLFRHVDDPILRREWEERAYRVL